jgi:hypothetical protein
MLSPPGLKEDYFLIAGVLFSSPSSEEFAQDKGFLPVLIIEKIIGSNLDDFTFSLIVGKVSTELSFRRDYSLIGSSKPKLRIPSVTEGIRQAERPESLVSGRMTSSP